MSKLKSTIRLHTEGKSKRFIASYLKLSRNTVIKYIRRFIALKLTYESLTSMSDRELYRLFQMSAEKELPEKLRQLHHFFPYVEKQIKKPGVTLHLLWQQYLVKHPDGYRSSQFNEHYNR